MKMSVQSKGILCLKDHRMQVVINVRVKGKVVTSLTVTSDDHDHFEDVVGKFLMKAVLEQMDRQKSWRYESEIDPFQEQLPF